MSKTRTKKAFTLAETLITLTILGVIAAITVPGLVRRQVELANRTKIKKAMRSYDLAINKMVVENGLKNDEALVSFAGDENNNCAGSSSYFKQAEGTGCVFKTSDGVWWNITDINKVIIALTKDDLNKETADSDTNRAFYLLSWFDNKGTLRIDDLAAATGGDKEIIARVYDYITAKTKMSKEEIEISSYSSINEWAKYINHDYDTPCSGGQKVSCTEVYVDGSGNVYDAEGNNIVEIHDCWTDPETSINSCAYDFNTFDSNHNMTSTKGYCTSTNTNCYTYTVYSNYPQIEKSYNKWTEDGTCVDEHDGSVVECPDALK